MNGEKKEKVKVVVVAQAVKGAEMKQWPRVRVHGTEIGTPGTALAPVTKIGFAGVLESQSRLEGTFQMSGHWHSPAKIMCI